MAISSNTPTQMLLDAGDLYINGVDVGATVGQGSFSVEQEIYFPELNGAIAGIAGTGKVVKETATLQVTIAELTVAKLLTVLPTLASSSDATSEYTTTPSVGLVGSSSHVTVHWQGTTTNSKTVQCLLYNALAEGGLTLNFEDGAETSYQVTFRSYNGASAPKARNWKVAVQR